MNVSIAEFNKLLVEYTPYVRYLVSRRLGGDDLEDKVQDVLLSICQRRDGFDPTKGKFVTWVWWQVRARAQELATYTRRRRHINYQPDVHETGEEVAEPLAVGGDPHECLVLRETLDAVLTLKPRQADAILQRAVGVSFADIGRQYGATQQYGQQLQIEGLKTLRKRTGHRPQQRRIAA